MNGPSAEHQAVTIYVTNFNTWEPTDLLETDWEIS